VAAAWTIRDGKGRLLEHYIGASRLEVGRKVVPARYDAFRLMVSSSYREMFNRQLNRVLQREDWRIVPLPRRTRPKSKAELQASLH